jgi:hypothetical protein
MNKILNSQTGTFLSLIAFILFSIYAMCPSANLWALASILGVIAAIGIISPDNATKQQLTNRAFFVILAINLGLLIEASYLAYANPSPVANWFPLIGLLALLEIVLAVGLFLYNWEQAKLNP